MTENTEALKGEQTLKHLLEFLARLQSSKHKDNVIKEIEKEVKGYVKDDGQKFGNPTTGYLFETSKKSNELRKNVVLSEDTYKHYTESFQNSNPDQCVKHLIDNIFPLFGCLYYMYYECAQQCSDIKGGEWYDEKCDGMGRYQYLNEWLKDQKPSTETSEDATDTPEDGTKRMIQRGFEQGDLSDREGDKLFPKSESARAPESLLDYQYGAQLQFCLYYMLFLPGKWNDAQSGHAVLFLEAFCEKVSENKFNGQYTNGSISMDTLKPSCETLKDTITALIDSNTIVPVACSDTVDYKDLLEATHFWSYIKWLEDNLEQLIKSLTDMESDASNWTETNLMTSKSFGPFPWGFTFRKHNWESKTGQIKQQLSQLTEALGGLKKALPSASEAKSVSKGDTEEPSVSTSSTNSAEKSSASTVSTTSTVFTTSADSTTSNNSTDSTASTASTVGGVAAGLGAAAGAAYAGSGILGPAAEAIGKFFRGLFL